jgi:flavin reductase (DIM6/NTAB) family NADH-FMN oxidoreductase RutF
MAARYGDRLAGVDTFVDASGTPYIAGSAAWLRTTLVSETLLGDHLLAALAVHSLKVGPGAPLVFHESAFKGCAALGAETSS